MLLSRIWHGWDKSLILVKPETVIRWHRKGFRLYWKRKSRGPGRPKVCAEIRDLIRQMSRANEEGSSRRGAQRNAGKNALN